MKRAKSIVALVLAALLVLSLAGCKGRPAEESTAPAESEASSQTKEESSPEESSEEESAEDSSQESEESSEESSEETKEESAPQEEKGVYTNEGLILKIPEQYQDLVEVTMEEMDEEGCGTLFSVVETASRDAAVNDGYSPDDGFGFVFSIARVQPEEAQGLVDDDIPGNTPFALDQRGLYYVLRFPTDVRYYRSTREEWHEDENLITQLYYWSQGVPHSFVEDNADRLTSEELTPQKESEQVDPQEILNEDPFEGLWVCGRASLEIAKLGAGYKAHIMWAGSASEVGYWNYTLEYDEAEDWLSGVGEEVHRVYNEDGSIESEETTTDQRVIIRLNDDGNIVWEDWVNDAGADMEFEYAADQPETPSAETIANGYFRGVGSETVAGAAYVVLRFADDNELWNVPGNEFRDELLKAWNSLSQDEQKNFDMYFMDVVALLDNIFENWSEVQGFVHEMGLEDQFIALRESPLAEKSWTVLKAATLTMGNSTGE